MFFWPWETGAEPKGKEALLSTPAEVEADSGTDQPRDGRQKDSEHVLDVVVVGPLEGHSHEGKQDSQPEDA